MLWEPPSPRARELIRQGAEFSVRAPEAWLEQIDEATLSGPHRKEIADDPVLAAATRRANRSNLLFWAAANVQAPGERVPANVSEPQVLIARDLVRRGLDHSVLDSYRSGQMAALRLWTEICFGLTADHDELREVLDVSSRSISAFVEDTIAATAEQIAREREELTRGSNAERLETATLLLDGAPIAAARAEQRLGYRLGGEHTAAVVWSDAPETGLGALDRAAELVATATGDPRPLTIQAGVATRWVWTHGRPDPERLRAEVAIAGAPGIRVAVGSTGEGVDGFRRGHLDALTVQRMLARLDSPHPLATHDEVELVALLTADRDASDRFVHRVLGALATADRELVDSLRTFIACRCNAAQAAEVLYIHRNTLLRRLARADTLLPRPLSDGVAEVAAALAVLRWRGGA